MNKRNKGQSVIDTFGLETPFATEFRRLLHKIEHHPKAESLDTIMVTSAMLSEGKSTISAFLAITAALHRGLRTLLVDCDLRRPTIHKLFALDRSPGLAEILGEGYDVRQAIKKTPINKLDLLTCGGRHESPTQLFDAEVLGTLFDQLNRTYDLLLVDAAPLLPVSDPMLLAPRVDGILLVIKAGQTQRDVVSRGLEILGSYRRNVLGVVMNNMDAVLPYQYDYSYYGYEYRSRDSKRKGHRSSAAPRSGQPNAQRASRRPVGPGR